MFQYIKKRLRSFKFAFRGIAVLFRETDNLKIHLVAAVAAICCGVWLHITREEWLAVIIVIGCVLAAEAFNSTVEELADFACKKERYPAIKKVKDLSAGAVLIVALVALAVGIIVFLPKIIALCS